VVVAQQVAFGEPGSAATTGGDSSVRIFDTRSGRQTAVLRGHAGFVEAVAFSPDGTLVATGGADGTARVWDAATGAQLAVLRGHGAAVNGVVFTPDGGRVVTAGEDGTIRFWDTGAGRPAVWSGRPAGFSADGDYVATVRAGIIRLWRTADGAAVARLRGPRGAPYEVGVADGGPAAAWPRSTQASGSR
jgi:WD40 repeat protein